MRHVLRVLFGVSDSGKRGSFVSRLFFSRQSNRNRKKTHNTTLSLLAPILVSSPM